MSFKNIIKYFLRLIIAMYFSAVFIYILSNVGSKNKNTFIDAFSPSTLFGEVVSGNWLFILYTIIVTAFILRFNVLRRRKVDYEEGGRAWPWP